MSEYLPYLVIGGAIGWLASLMAGAKPRVAVFLNVLLGIAGACLAGLFAPSTMTTGGAITPEAILTLLGGAFALLLAFRLLTLGRGR